MCSEGGEEGWRKGGSCRQSKGKARMKSVAMQPCVLNTLCSCCPVGHMLYLDFDVVELDWLNILCCWVSLAFVILGVPQG